MATKVNARLRPRLDSVPSGMSEAVGIGRKLYVAPAPTRLRQIALIATDLERAKKLLTDILGTEVIYEDPAVAQWGLRNFLVPLGGDIIEVVSPFEADTTAGWLLEKREEGGYMIIMQTEDAKKRREYIEANGLAKVIFGYEHGDTVCVQYHPKGGMIPELDSHAPSHDNPTPLTTRFSPWHACGSHGKVYPGMRHTEHLSLEGCVLRLQPDDADHEAAARKWEAVFGVGRSRDLLVFTNAQLGFISGRPGQPDGRVSITVGVNSTAKRNAILQRARDAGICGNGWFDVCGVKWYVVLTGLGGDSKSKL